MHIVKKILIGFVPNYLIKNGASLVTIPEDIIKEYEFTKYEEKVEKTEIKIENINEEKILKLLSEEILLPEEIANSLKIDFIETMQLLSKLEIEERIEETPSGYKII